MINLPIGDFPLGQQGWICPRCQKVNAPFNPQCFCNGTNQITVSGTNQELKFCHTCQSIMAINHLCNPKIMMKTQVTDE